MEDIKEPALPEVDPCQGCTDDTPKTVKIQAPSPAGAALASFVRTFLQIVTVWSIIYIIFHAIGAGLADGFYG